MERDPILELVAQIQAGIDVEQSSAAIFRRFRHGVQSFFTHKGFSVEESRDLTQDVFLRVFNRIDTFRRESRFERWLWDIAAHVYFNEVRRRRTEKRDGHETSLDATVETVGSRSPALALPTTDPSPQENAIQQEQIAAFHAALRELPDQMRRCCIMRYERSMKYQEISIVMGISIDAVKKYLHQARQRLAALLEARKYDVGASDSSSEEKEDSESWSQIRQAKLLKKIYQLPSLDFSSRYQHLVSLRDSEQLSETEARELLDLSDQLERMTVERLEALAELAIIRGVPLRSLALEMGIKPIVNA